MNRLPYACVVLTLVVPLLTEATSDAVDLELNARYWGGQNEPEVPVLAAPSERGFHGRAAPMVRIGPDNATDAEDRVGRATAWRNERVNLQFVVWTGESVPGLRVLPDDLTSASGGVIPKSAIDVRFVRNVLGRPADRSKMADHGARAYGDVLDRDLRVDLPRNGYRAFWLTVRTPKDISTGLYKGGFRVVGNGGRSVAFGIELEVVDRMLPDPKDWKFHLNLWQHPNNVAKYHGVAPFSKEHLKLMVPLYRELAEAGQKVITARIEERPWLENGRYCAQVLHRRRADGSFVHDYTIFDLYVSFAQRAGLGPFIACSTIAHRKNNHVFFVDETNGDLVNQPFAVESDESDAFWGAFLKDFERHLREKGWMENAYIDLDELNLKDAEAALGIIRRHAPAFKVEFACDKAPAKFLDFKTEHYSQGLRTPTERMFPPEFWTGLAERGRNPDFVTTFYVCNLPGTPNTWVRSDYDECAWQGLFAAAKGFSGFLRWAAFCWGRNPLWDASCTPKYDAGESFLFYPGMRSSPRWEALRDSFENYEKIRILRETSGMTPELEAALAAMNLDCVVEQYADEAAFKVGRDRVSAQVQPVLKALEEASRAQGK